MQRSLSHRNPPAHTCTHTCTHSNQYDFTLWFCTSPLKLSYNVIIACDKWRGYIQTIKQLIAFDRRHIWSVKVLQAEKCCLSVSVYFLFLFSSQSLPLTQQRDIFIYFWIMLICSFWKLGGKNTADNIVNCSLSHINVNTNVCVCVHKNKHTRT